MDKARDRCHSSKKNKHDKHEDVHGWQNLECPANPKTTQSYGAIFSVVAKQGSRDEESAQDKKKIDTERSQWLEERDLEMIADDLKGS